MASKCITCLVAAVLALTGVMPVYADTTMAIQGSDGLNTSIQIRNGKGRIGSSGREDICSMTVAQES